MYLPTLKSLYTRDLMCLHKEIEAYTEETDMWKVPEGVTNSGGNLCLHLIGNLKTFIGAGLADTGYIRDREFEFNGKGVPRAQLLLDIEETIKVVELGLTQAEQLDPEGDFPTIIWKEPKSVTFTLLHLHAHLNYHLGQINYHRRIVSGLLA